MRLFGYYLIHTFVNGIKKLFRTWVAVLLGFIVLCGVFGGVLGMAIGSAVEDPSFESTYEEDIYEEEADPEDWSAVERQNIYNFTEVLAGGIILVVLLVMVYTSDKSGTSIFIMPDVNFLFTAPMKPQSVLLFRLLMQMGTTIVASIYLIFQLPNLILNLGLSWPVALALLGCWLLTLLFGKLLSVMVYTLIATHEGLRRYVRIGVFAVAGLVAAAVYATVALKEMNFAEAAVWLFGSNISRLVPGWGWLKGMVGCALSGSWWGVALCVVGVLALCAVLVYFTWRIKADFYEDALAHATQLQEAQVAAAEGRGAKRKKERTDRLRRDGLFGRGAAMFLTRGIYNHHRFGKLWLFSSTGITYTAVFLFVTVLMRLFGGEAVGGLLIVPAILVAFIAFFRNLGNPLEEDMRGHLLYLVPAAPGKKLLCALLAGSYDTLLDVLPGLLLCTLLIQAPVLEAAGWLALIVTMDFLISVLGLMLQMLLPSSLPQQVHGLLQLMLKMLVLLVPILLVAVLAVALNIATGLLVAATVNGLVGALLLWPAAHLLHGGRN